jgi:DNA-directed RNA polymerase subunit RPC12/RpoP
VGVDTPALEHDNEHDEAIHEHIVEHVTRALHREDSGIWSGSDEEEAEEEEAEEGNENEREGNSDEEVEDEQEEEDGGVKIDKNETVTIEMSGDNLYMGTDGHSSSDEDAASEASSMHKGDVDDEHDDAAGEASSAGTPSAFASEEETAADAEEEEDEGGIPISDSAPPSRRNRETAPSVIIRSINRTAATTMPNPPTRSLTSTAPALPMILQPSESEDVQVKLPKDRHIADSDLEWMYLAPLDGAKRTVKYVCANLGNSGLEEHETEVSFGEPMRCKTCACRVLWKKRTERMVQFEAR